MGHGIALSDSEYTGVIAIPDKPIVGELLVNDLCLSGHHLRGSNGIVCSTCIHPPEMLGHCVPITILINSLDTDQLLTLANALAHSIPLNVLKAVFQNDSSLPFIHESLAIDWQSSMLLTMTLRCQMVMPVAWAVASVAVILTAYPLDAVWSSPNDCADYKFRIRER